MSRIDGLEDASSNMPVQVGRDAEATATCITDEG